MAHAFEAALKKLEANAAPPPPPPARGPAVIAGGFDAAAAVATAAGVHSLWELAAAWTPEADPPPPPPPPPPPAREPPPSSANAEDVARDLGLSTLQSAADINRARRRFMWDNHPDRRSDVGRDLANRRVAVANMLLDAALAKLQRRR